MAQKNPPAMQETQETGVRSLGWENPLEEKMATHSSMRVGKSHGQGILVSGSPWGHKELDTTECAYDNTTVGSTHLFQRADQMLQFDPTITQ